MSLVQNFCWGWGGVKGWGEKHDVSVQKLVTQKFCSSGIPPRSANWFLIRLDAGKRDLDIRSVLARQG